MNVVTLHVLHTEPSADFGLLRIAAPALEPEARVVLWEGLPPAEIPHHPGLAPVVLQGDVEGHRAYAEQVPSRLRLSDAPLPASLAAYVGARLARAVAALHASGGVHGLVQAGRVFLGPEGEVVLAGLGRRGASVALDRGAVRAVLADIGQDADEDEPLAALADRLQAAADPSDGRALGAWVAARVADRPTLLGQVHLQAGPSPDSLDEVVPDLGPEGTDGEGLLDRWAVTTFDGRGDEITGERTDAGLGPSSPLALTLWTRLAAPPEHAPPADRFAQVAGEPSRGLRALLLEEAPDSLPALLGGDVGPFLLHTTEPDADEEAAPSPFDVSDPGITPGLHDDDGDTAIYDLQEKRLAEAIRKADTRSALAELEARVADAERRARAAEIRARSAEARAARADPTGGEAGLLVGFLRAEVFVALLLGALLVWLAFRAFG